MNDTRSDAAGFRVAEASDGFWARYTTLVRNTVLPYQWAALNDRIAGALQLIGDKWTMLVVRDLFAGPKRTTELLEDLHPISSRTLMGRLREMEKVFKQRPVPANDAEETGARRAAAQQTTQRGVPLRKASGDPD